MTEIQKMSLDDALPELREGLAKQPSLPVTNPVMLWLGRIFLDVLFRLPKGVNEGVAVSVVPLGNASIRLYEPEGGGVGAGILWIHGGGMILGNAKMNDPLCSHYARALGVVVASVEYRLAPRHPYPAAIDDCFAVWEWLQENGHRLGVNPQRVAVGGQSAGGGLGAALCQRIFDIGGIQPAGQFLSYPMIDDRTAAMTDIDAVEHLIWPNKYNRFGWSAYLGHEVGRDQVPAWSVAGRREDLSGLPTARIGVGSLDLCVDDSKSYAERLKRAGVECELDIVEGAPHGFDVLVPDADVSKAFASRTEQFLRKCLRLDDIR
ncbi:MAG: alpha/beta hydrolase [Congregibacter sp.]